MSKNTAPTPQPATPEPSDSGGYAFLVQEIEYGRDHGWPQETLRKLERMAAAWKQRKATPVAAAEPVPSSEPVAEPDDIERAKDILGSLCDRGYVRMSIPARPTDDDMVLSRVINLAMRALKAEEIVVKQQRAYTDGFEDALATLPAPQAAEPSPFAPDANERLAVRASIDAINNAVCVFGDVLNDIADWEDKALEEACLEAQSALAEILSPTPAAGPATPAVEPSDETILEVWKTAWGFGTGEDRIKRAKAVLALAAGGRG